ncbi:YhfG family protein [Pseudomonas nitroreducens]|uniref:YhfG family protein n=1 Tax=Pseudomonas nitroreducens TaxID=46680 RepID=UPI002892B030|nr:YhfG family protein [Pseudomonas nitritireducens]
MKTPSLQAKKAYCARTRRLNYAASLRLEGYDVAPAEASRELPTREAALKIHRQPA